MSQIAQCALYCTDGVAFALRCKTERGFNCTPIFLIQPFPTGCEHVTGHRINASNQPKTLGASLLDVQYQHKANKWRLCPAQMRLQNTP